jgi:glycosyltransferase involved in cell wall biosynthesis
VFVGQEADGGALRHHAEMRELGGRVRFLGRRTLDEFADLAAATDLGVNLRRPPTNGETSAALLNLLSSGVATIVTDVATFSDYPSHAVRKVRWEAEGQEGLRRAIGELARDKAARESMGQAAWEYVRAHHEWPRAAERYVEVIERCLAERNAARPGRRSSPRPQRVGVDTIGRDG